MRDCVLVSNPTELEDVPAIERATGERARFIVHGPDLFHLVVGNVEPLAPVSDLLLVEEALHKRKCYLPSRRCTCCWNIWSANCGRILNWRSRLGSCLRNRTCRSFGIWCRCRPGCRRSGKGRRLGWRLICGSRGSWSLCWRWLFGRILILRGPKSVIRCRRFGKSAKTSFTLIPWTCSFRESAFCLLLGTLSLIFGSLMIVCHLICRMTIFRQIFHSALTCTTC